MMMEETTTHNFFNYNADDDRGSRGVGHRELQQVQQQQQQQQQNQNWNVADQQQQFEQNVQDLFGIGGGQMSSQANNNNEVAYNNYNAAGQYYDYNPFTDANTKDVNTSAFMTAVCLNAMLFVVLVVGYELFRRWLPTVYSPKRGHQLLAGRIPVVVDLLHRRLHIHPPPLQQLLISIHRNLWVG